MIAPFLLAWYDAHGRSLPFRGTKDPYGIWVSEIMLQQTRTETVTGYYTRFLARFPSVFSLAAAEEEEVLKLWEGLGYYSRARHLHAAAKRLVSDYHGVFPRDEAALRALPGVGAYTAAAVASIAFDLPCPAMDGNLTRVFSRLYAVHEDVGRPSVQRLLYSLARGDMPAARCGDFNQALMDLGATICTPGTPDCDRCPLFAQCLSRQAGDADTLPVKAAAKAPEEKKIAVGIVVCEGQTCLIQRRETLLHGLWVFPLTEAGDDAASIEKRCREMGISIKETVDLGQARHVFTHRIWQMKLYCLHAEKRQSRLGSWVDKKGMDTLAIPTAMRAAKAHALRILGEND